MYRVCVGYVSRMYRVCIGIFGKVEPYFPTHRNALSTNVSPGNTFPNPANVASSPAPHYARSSSISYIQRGINRDCLLTIISKHANKALSISLKISNVFFDHVNKHLFMC